MTSSSGDSCQSAYWRGSREHQGCGVGVENGNRGGRAGDQRGVRRRSTKLEATNARRAYAPPKSGRRGRPRLTPSPESENFMPSDMRTLYARRSLFGHTQRRVLWVRKDIEDLQHWKAKQIGQRSSLASEMALRRGPGWRLDHAKAGTVCGVVCAESKLARWYISHGAQEASRILRSKIDLRRGGNRKALTRPARVRDSSLRGRFSARAAHLGDPHVDEVHVIPDRIVPAEPHGLIVLALP